MSIFGTSLCLTACGKSNNQNDNITTEQDSMTAKPIETEMDSVVSPDTVMPAP